MRYVLIVALLAILWLFPSMQATFWLNMAQIQNLRGDTVSTVQLLERALELDPDRAHIRWQLGASLSQAGDPAAAATVLRPLMYQHLNVFAASLFFDTLLDSRQIEPALRSYVNWSPAPVLHSRTAARLALQYVERQGTLPKGRADLLLNQALHQDRMAPDLQVLFEQLTLPDFWKTETGDRLWKALLWRGQRAPEIDTVSTPSTPAHQRVAAMLRVAPDMIQVGENRAINSDFEHVYTGTDELQGQWSTLYQNTGRPRFNRATFVVGTDSKYVVRGHRSLRIDGLFIEELPGLEPARVSLLHWPITLESGIPYVVSFAYRTTCSDDSIAGFMLLAQSGPLQGRSFLDRRLPATCDRWQRVTMLFWGETASAERISPLFRALKTGSVWYDDFSIRPVQTDIPVPRQDTIVQVDDESWR